MKTDHFTKILLSIIAFNLCVLTLGNFDLIPRVTAGDSNPPNYGLHYGLVPLNEDGTISVKLNNADEINVNITDISTSDMLNVNLRDISTYDKLDVSIAEIETSDKLDVNLESVDAFAFTMCTVPVELND